MTACVLALTAGVAVADTWELNGIKGNMASAEDRFKTGNLDNARFFVDQVKDGIAKAKPDTKADPELAKIQARLKALEDKLGKAEGDAGVVASADAKMDEARSDWMFAKSAGTQDPDEAIAKGASCVTKLEDAFKGDAAAHARQIRSAGITGDDMMKQCKDIADKAKRFNAGEGKQRASDTDYGKAGIPAFNVAYKAFNNKDLDAIGLVDGQGGAVKCKSAYGSITSITMTRTRKPFYDETAETMATDAGKITLKQFGDQCLKMEIELTKRKVSGCGHKQISVEQEMIARDRWGSIASYGTTVYTPDKCTEMPKSNKWAGSSSTFAAQFRKSCGAGAIIVVTEGNWHTWDSNGKVLRSIDGVCWEKGKLNFGSGGASVVH